jgi:hypothetical protein
VQPRRRGGRPPPTKRANPRPRPRRTRTQQGQHNPPTAANSLLREGQNRPRPGAPFTSSNHAASSAMPATPLAPPLSPAVTRRNGRSIADSANLKQPRMSQAGPAQLESTNRHWQQPFEGRTKPAAARSTVHQQQPCRQLRYACDPFCPAPAPSCDTSEWQGHC